MVDDSRIVSRCHNTLSDASSSEEPTGINGYYTGREIIHEKKNSIADYNQQVRRIRKDPNLGQNQSTNNYDDDNSSIDLNNEEGIEFPVPRKSRFKSSSDELSESSGSSPGYQPKRARKKPNNSRSSIRPKKRRVNYKEADDLSDADYSNDYVKKSKANPVESRYTGNPRLQTVPPVSLTRDSTSGAAKIAEKRKRVVEEVDEEEDEDDLDSDQDSQLSYNPKEIQYTVATEDQDIIEEVLLHEIRRVGATGNSSTMYNVRLEKDPNSNFDPSTEKGELQYLIKWKNWSHIHSTWETEASLSAADRGTQVGGMKKLKIYKENMRKRDRIRSFENEDQLEAMQCEDEQVKATLAKKMEVERIVAHSRDTESNCYDYLVKWCRLEYRNCTWESGRVVEALYPRVVKEYERRCKSITLPNLRHPALRMRPKFQRFIEQPSYLGRTNSNNTHDRLELREYQLNGLNWLAHAWCRGNSVILADEMGLGKTIQTISFLSYLFHTHQLYGPFLLVVPLSTISNWCYECGLWAEEMNTIAYIGDNVSRQLIREHEWSSVSKKNQALKFNICITTYEILLKDKNWLCNVPWAMLAVDEAHRLKNDQSQLYKALFTFNTNSRVLVTGTPLQNSLKELWALLHFIMPNEFHEWEEFEEAYSIQDSGETSGDALKKLHRVLEPYLLRRVKRDVEYSLPEKIERVLRVGMSSRQADMYRMILARNYDGLMRVTNGHKASFVNIMMELKKCCNHTSLIAPLDGDEAYHRKDAQERLNQLVKGSGKLMLLDQLLQKLKPNGHRVLIFSQMVRMLDIIASYLELRRWGFQRLDGSISGEDRKQALNHFNAENSTDFCFLLSTRAGGLGINLATADTVIIFDSDWNPQNDLQAQARAHRIGQKKQVSVYRLVTKDSIEEKIIESATRKMVLDHLVIQKMDSSGGAKQFAKTDTRGKLYSEILKHGAESLFPLENDDNEPVVDIDTILDQAETRQISDDTPSNHPANALLSTFSIVNVNSLDESKPVIMNQSSKGAAPVKDWDDIIPDHIREKYKNEEEESKLINCELGPRIRKKVNTFQAGQEDDSDSSESRSLSDKEIRAVLKSMRKFPHPLNRVEEIIADAELSNCNDREVTVLMEQIIEGCKDTLTEVGAESKTATFTIGKVSMVAKQVLGSIEDLEVIEDYLFKGISEKQDRLKLALPFVPKAVNWNCIWTDIDDVGLLVGICEHGYDNWESIKLDSDIGLGSKLLPLNGSDRPQSSHIRTRVEYLVKSLRKHQFEGDKPPPQPKSSKSKSFKSAKMSESKSNNENVKSAKYVESDAVTSSEESSVISNTKPAKKKKKSSTKKSSKGPMHFTSTGQPVTLADEAEKQFEKMKGILFETCKKLMRPIRKLFRRLEDAEEEENSDYNSLVIEIGQHIKQIVKKFSSHGLKHVILFVNSEEKEAEVNKAIEQLSSILATPEDMKKYLWKFVQFFSKKTSTELESLYSWRKKSSNHNNDQNSSRRHHSSDKKHSSFNHSSQNGNGSGSSSYLLNNSSETSSSRFDNAFNRLPTSLQNNNGRSNNGHRSSGHHESSSSHYSKAGGGHHHGSNDSSFNSMHNESSTSSTDYYNKKSYRSSHNITSSGGQHQSNKRSYSGGPRDHQKSVNSFNASVSTPSSDLNGNNKLIAVPATANLGLSSRDPRLQNHH